LTARFSLCFAEPPRLFWPKWSEEIDRGDNSHAGAAKITVGKVFRSINKAGTVWGVGALHPQSFLIEVFRQEQALVMAKLEQQAADRSRSLRQLLDILDGTVPDFASLVSDAISRK
jgi:hypothetical protein